MSLDKAKAHYSELIKGSKVEIKVPEWDTTIYLRPMNCLSVKTASKVRKFINMDDAEGAANVIACLATTTSDDTGDKLAYGSPADLQDLKYKVDASVVMRIFTEWVTKSTEAAAEASKEIKKP